MNGLPQLLVMVRQSAGRNDSRCRRLPRCLPEWLRRDGPPRMENLPAATLSRSTTAQRDDTERLVGACSRRPPRCTAGGVLARARQGGTRSRTCSAPPLCPHALARVRGGRSASSPGYWSPSTGTKGDTNNARLNKRSPPDLAAHHEVHRSDRARAGQPHQQAGGRTSPSRVGPLDGLLLAGFTVWASKSGTART